METTDYLAGSSFIEIHLKILMLDLFIDDPCVGVNNSLFVAFEDDEVSCEGESQFLLEASQGGI